MDDPRGFCRERRRVCGQNPPRGNIAALARYAILEDLWVNFDGLIFAGSLPPSPGLRPASPSGRGFSDGGTWRIQGVT
jgi:hypothetical protein